MMDNLYEVCETISHRKRVVGGANEQGIESSKSVDAEDEVLVLPKGKGTTY